MESAVAICRPACYSLYRQPEHLNCTKESLLFPDLGLISVRMSRLQTTVEQPFRSGTLYQPPSAQMTLFREWVIFY